MRVVDRGYTLSKKVKGYQIGDVIGDEDGYFLIVGLDESQSVGILDLEDNSICLTAKNLEELYQLGSSPYEELIDATVHIENFKNDVAIADYYYRKGVLDAESRMARAIKGAEINFKTEHELEIYLEGKHAGYAIGLKDGRKENNLDA